MRTLCFGLLNCLVVAVCIAKAEAVEAPGNVLETLVIQRERLDQSALGSSSFSKSANEFLPGPRLDVAEVLVGLPGLQVDSRTNFAQDTRISLRGYGARSAFGVRGIDLFVDGVPMSMPDGQGQLSSILLGQVDSVQLVRGPLAELYGHGAGGVIALQTSLPETNAAQIGAAAGEQGMRQKQFNLSGRQDSLGASLVYAQSEQDGDRPHARAEREQWALQLFYESQNDLQARLKYELSDEPLLQDPLGLTPEQWRDDPYQNNNLAESFDTRKSVRHQQASLSLRQLNDQWHWQVASWTGSRDIEQFLGFSGTAITASGGVVDLERNFNGILGNLTYNTYFLEKPLSATMGLEWSGMEDYRRGYVNQFGVTGELRRNEVGEVDAHEAYLVFQWVLQESFDIYVGARHNQLGFEVSDSFVVPSTAASPGNPDDSGARDYADTAVSLGARWSIATGWGVSADLGRGFDTPTLTEMAYQREGTGLNTDLDAAVNQQYQMSLFYQAHNADLTLTRFAITTNNELVVDQSVNGRTSYVNAARTRRSGYELYGRWQASERWRLLGSLTWINAIYSGGDWNSNQLPGVAREQYQWDLQYRPWKDERLVIKLGVHKRSAVASNDANDYSAPGFYRIDVGVEREEQWGGRPISWWLTIANATDENYVGSVIVNQSNGRAFEPAPGRNVQCGVKMYW